MPFCFIVVFFLRLVGCNVRRSRVSRVASRRLQLLQLLLWLGDLGCLIASLNRISRKRRLLVRVAGLPGRKRGLLEGGVARDGCLSYEGLCDTTVGLDLARDLGEGAGLAAAAAAEVVERGPLDAVLFTDKLALQAQNNAAEAKDVEGDVNDRVDCAAGLPEKHTLAEHLCAHPVLDAGAAEREHAYAAVVAAAAEAR